MKVTLQLGDSRDSGTSYGRIEDPAGTYSGTLVYEGRQPCVERDDGAFMELPDELFCPALLEAFELVCMPIWGEEWAKPIAEIARIHPRNLSRGRVARNGVSAHILWLVLHIGAQPHPSALAYAMRGLARYLDAANSDADELARNVLEVLKLARHHRRDEKYSHSNLPIRQLSGGQ